MTKYIFVTGGVVSGLGKGIVAASLGRLLKERGYKIASQKLDPYMNVDPGTMSPFEHGEVFVTDDGAETDLDLGHYERFIDENLTKYSNLTSGKVYYNILSKERNGDYLGHTVQVVPHVTNEIKNFIYLNAKHTNADILITEIGGTTGDIESQPFLEAIRQIPLEVGRENCVFIHVTLVPYLSGSNELKSKPTQHSVKELQSFGIFPNVIVARCDIPLGEKMKEKISLFCNVKKECVIENLTLESIYEAPLMFLKSKLDTLVLKELGLNENKIDLTEWIKMTESIKTRNDVVKIALVGKYVKLHDAYLSVMEALSHAGYEFGYKIEIVWVDSEKITHENVANKLKGVSGVILPGGFGVRGVEGMIESARYSRENNIPYFGICLGMQIACIEFARNVLGLEDANSREFNEESKNKIIDFMPDQSGDIPKGGTMRLGAYPCKVKADTLLYKLYGQAKISERHRHRYEFNNDYRELVQKAGLTISGTSPDGHIVEAVEYDKNSFYIGVQFHPEFKSRPTRAHSIFRGFVKASIDKKTK